MRKSYLVAISLALIAGLIVALIITIPRAPVPVRQGSAPSVVTRSTGDEARAVTPAEAPRETAASSNTSRAARGSGVEGVTSAGTTQAVGPR